MSRRARRPTSPHAAASTLLRPASLRARAHSAGTRERDDVETAGRRRRGRPGRYARTFIGVPYRWGGMSPRTGFDCSGFVAFVYRHFGVSLPHYTVAQYQRGRRVARGALRPGDLVFFAGLSHVGLYVGGGRFVHAPHTGTRVS